MTQENIIYIRTYIKQISSGRAQFLQAKHEILKNVGPTLVDDYPCHRLQQVGQVAGNSLIG